MKRESRRAKDLPRDASGSSEAPARWRGKADVKSPLLFHIHIIPERTGRSLFRASQKDNGKLNP
jgi:hypothetical protein